MSGDVGAILSVVISIISTVVLFVIARRQTLYDKERSEYKTLQESREAERFKVLKDKIDELDSSAKYFFKEIREKIDIIDSENKESHTSLREAQSKSNERIAALEASHDVMCGFPLRKRQNETN